MVKPKDVAGGGGQRSGRERSAGPEEQREEVGFHSRLDFCLLKHGEGKWREAP